MYKREENKQRHLKLGIVTLPHFQVIADLFLKKRGEKKIKTQHRKRKKKWCKYETEKEKIRNNGHNTHP